MFDLHRHDMFSAFDGFGNPEDLANYAKEIGYNALCTTNHGNTNGLIQTYEACHKIGIKPILGCEGYVLPKYKEKTRGFHLVLIAMNRRGYANLNRIQFEADKQRYYNPIWDFDILARYSDGLICTTACVASYSSQAIIQDNDVMAERFINKLLGIFDGRVYVEIQPYKIDDDGTQEKVNVHLINMSLKNHWKMILTSDSHRGRKGDMDTYLKMHDIAGHDLEHIEQTYAERYMPLPDEMRKRFYRMHRDDFGKEMAKKLAIDMYENLNEIERMCDGDYLDDMPMTLPDMGCNGETAEDILYNKVMEGLERRGVHNAKYVKRCRDELEVITYHGFDNYFLMVSDYVNWAKERGIAVGPGRGSVCNSLVAYVLGITEVDSLMFGLDFRRFLRKDKKSYPDIDLDFETDRRQEVIDYLCEKYEGHAARICSYGTYRLDNLINDLAKVCGVFLPSEQGDEKVDKEAVRDIKATCSKYIDDSSNLDSEGLMHDRHAAELNRKHDGVIRHFCLMYKKVRFIGTHAAGVAITGGDILDYTALRYGKDGNVYTAYDLEDIEKIGVIKFDILGLKTMEGIRDMRDTTGVTVSYPDIVRDKKVMSYFKDGRTDGVFQLEKRAAKNMLTSIGADDFRDVIAVNAMNRPGPLSLKMHELYAANKHNPEGIEDSSYYEYTKDSYGTIIYQEQVQQICVNIGHMSWGDADKVMKLMKVNARGESDENALSLLKSFVDGAAIEGLSKREATDLFEKMTSYTFNKGHATGYALIAVEEMYYKAYFPNEFWYSKIRHARNESDEDNFRRLAVQDGSVILLPHINMSSAKTTLRTIDGDRGICLGLSTIKGIGEKAAEAIVEERKRMGPFTSFDNFYDRCKKGAVSSKVVDLLIEYGCTEMNRSKYFRRVAKYNSDLYGRR